MDLGRLAITLPALFLPARACVELAVRAERELGYHAIWLAETAGPDSFTLAGAIAAATSRVAIGTAVVPVYTRTPAVLAATANALGQILPGRFVMGLGSSSQTMMEGWHGLKLDKPVTRVRETAIMVRSMLKGEKSEFDFTTLKSHGYRQFPLESPPPIYLAALRPNMIEMAAEFGDGVIFNLWPNRALPKMMEHVRIGAERAGKDWRALEIVNRAMVLVTDDKKDARNRFRAAFAPYYATPVYNAFLAWAGYEEAADAISKGWAAKNRDMTTGALTDALIDEIAIIGTEEECRARVLEDAKGGVHTHIVAPLAGAKGDEVMRTFNAFTPSVFELG
jgi:probable F420-dependent oxidoreductase